MAWPHNRSDWPGKFDAIEWVVAEVARHLSRDERVEILVRNSAGRPRVRRMLADAGADLDRIRLHTFPTDRSWTRDTVPTFVQVREGGSVKRSSAEASGVVDWKFNGWARYRNWRRDDAVGEWLAGKLRLPRFLPLRPAPRRGTPRRDRVVLEGGAIDVNGAGLLLTTEECLLSAVQARNPGVTRRQMEKILADYLGVEKVLWLGRGIVGDDTHGHVDDLARFVGSRTVVTSVEKNTKDPNHRPLQNNLDRLRRMTDLKGRRLKVVTLPMPEPLVFKGRRLPASYANFYIANRKVLVPTFNASSHADG
jgi:agmatine deiminase